MSQQSSSEQGQSNASRHSFVVWLLIRVGLVVIVAGLGLATYNLLTFGDPSEAREFADSSVEALSDSIDSVQDAMGGVAAGETARAALEGDEQALEAITEELRAAGVRGIIDVRVFPPRAENIDLGNYPEPDFGVVQMLIEARRQDTARARIHYPSTSNENLAFAEAIPDEDGEAIIGMLFVRLTPDRLEQRIADPGDLGWLRLVQDDTVLIERARREVPADDRFRLVVPGSELVIEWGVLPPKGPLTLVQSLAVALLGVGFLGAAALLPRLPERRKKPARESREPRPAVAEVERRVEPRVAKAPPPEPEPEPELEPELEPEPEKDEPRPDLPDWMVEDGGLGGDDSPFGDQPLPGSGASPGGDDSGPAESRDEAKIPDDDMDVPDLDQILADIGDEPGPSSESLPDESGEAQPESERAESGSFEGDEEDDGPTFELEPDLLSDSEPADVGSDAAGSETEDIEPGESGLELESDAVAESVSGEEDEAEPETDSESLPDTGLDFDADLKGDAAPQPELEEGLASDAQGQRAPEPDLSADNETLGLAGTDSPETVPSDPDSEALVLLDEMRSELAEDTAPKAEDTTESEHEPEPEDTTESEHEPEQEDAPEPVGARQAVLEDALETESDQDRGTTEQTEPVGEAEQAPSREQEPVPAFAPELFHDEAIRGVFEDTLDVERAVVLGRAIGTLASRRGLERFVVGRDGRFSGPVLLSAVIRGLREAGIDVIELGALPTPLLWFGALELTDGCGVMVTASHHVSDENGFLVMLGGESLYGRELARIDEVAARGEFSEGEGGYEQDDIVDRYKARFTAEVKLERSLKVVVDCANGIAGSVAPALFEAVGIDVIPLYCDVDGSFPNHPADPAKTGNLEDLRLCVRNFQADAGIALDGDGDALVLVSDMGDVVRADQLLMLLAEPVLSAHPGAAVVVDVRCPSQVRSWIEKAGGRVVVERTGAGYVAAAMRDKKAVLGAAMTSHLLVADRWYTFEDGLHAAARVLELVASESGSASSVLERLPGILATDEMTLPVESGEVEALIGELAHSGDFGEAEQTTIDGLRIDHPDRWGLIRPLATEGLAGLSFGADNAEALKRIKAEFREQLLAVDPALVLPY